MSYRHHVTDWLAHPRTEPKTAGSFMATLNHERWMNDALCSGSDPDAWFPQLGQHNSRTRMAVRICHVCPVREECLSYAVRHDLLGIWGGTTDHDRRPLRQKAAAQ